MYCPRCGQQLMSDARFCSRCGLPLHLVSEIVANNGFAFSDAGGTKIKTPRQEGMRLGGKLMFIGLALAPVCLGLSFLLDGPVPLFFPTALFFAGLCWMLYSRIFAEDTVYFGTENQAGQFRNAKPKSFTLLPNRTPLAGVDSRRMNTADIPHSSGVTDHTTQLFD